MKKVNSIIGMLLVAFVLSSCSLTLPVTATSNPLGKKVGIATAKGYFGLFFNADASIRQAARNGKITKISTVDIKQGTFWGIVVTYQTIVTGE